MKSKKKISRRFFDDKKLVKKYGGWVRAQVAFYDFIFKKATQMCIDCFKEKALAEISAGFADGEFIYEKSVEAINGTWASFEEAWQDFVKQEYDNSHDEEP